ncbi:MAG: hypothetical protein AAB284_01100, partial [Chloroflexota bacterium]
MAVVAERLDRDHPRHAARDARHVHAEGYLDVPQVQLRLPAQAVEFGEGFGGKLAVIEKRGMADAKVTRETRSAEAEGVELAGLAHAKSTREQLLAEAEGLKQKGLSEAEGLREKGLADAQVQSAGADAIGKRG